MNSELEHILTLLAERFGTTVNHLWEVMIRQAYISAGVHIFQLVVVVVGFIYGYKLFNWLREERETADDEFYYDMGVIALATLSGFTAVIAFFSLPDLATKLFNPEYWALQQILDALGG